MATAQEINQPILYDRYYTISHPTVAASVTLWAGTLAMNDGGVAKPAASGIAGGALLGLVYETIDNAGVATPLVPISPPIYLRGLAVEMEGLPADLPKATELGKPVAILDATTIKKTIAANDLTATLLAILPGNRFRVWIA